MRADGGRNDLILDAEAGGEDHPPAEAGDKRKPTRQIEPGKRGVEGSGIGRGIC